MQTPGRLKINAIIVDSVAHVGLEFPSYVEDFATIEVTSVLESWRDLAIGTTAEVKSRHFDKQAFEVKGLGLLAVALFREKGNFRVGDGYNISNFEKWIENKARTNVIKGLCSEQQYGWDDTRFDWEDLSLYWFEEYVKPSWEGQRVFRSHANRLGMGGSQTSPGDIIVLAAGCDVPLILRQCGEFYTYIGPTAFPGAMQGELWPSSKNKLTPMILE